MNVRYADRMDRLKASEIRELLKVTENKDVISFGGGLPAPELFPVKEIMAVSQIVLKEQGMEALQYTTTEGFRPLREWVAKRMNQRQGMKLTADGVLLTNGSQQALDLTGKIFLNEDDTILCESPTYLAAISAFKAYTANFIEVPTDDAGMDMDALEELLKKEKSVKLIYVIPNFQNPTGRSWSLERRKKLAALSAAYGIIVIEDNPYGELRFEGEDLPAVKSFDQAGNILCLGTFSKTFCPGYRIGWIAGAEAIIEKYVLAKQGADLQCNTLAQREIMKYLELYDIDLHIEKIKNVYLRRRNLAVATMEECFPRGVRFTRPEGGLFLFAELPKGLTAVKLFERCMSRNVAFVPGDSFFPNGGRVNTFRINFSNMPEERLVKGLRIIGEEIEKMLAAAEG